MAIRRIVTLEDPVLRKRAHRVTTFDTKFQKLIDDMMETLLDAPGVGLAAPQVGVSQRVFVARLPDDEESQKEFGDLAGKEFVVVNPEVVKASREKVEGIEACLSLPQYAGKVVRHQNIVIKGQDRHGKPLRLKASDWLARVFQHEMDHLDGRLYIDIASEVWKEKPKEEGENAQPAETA